MHVYVHKRECMCAFQLQCIVPCWIMDYLLDYGPSQTRGVAVDSV